MDLTKEIRKEHSKTMAHKIAGYVGNNPTRFKALLNIYLGGPYRITQRAAYPLGVCAERYPELIMPHLSKLIHFVRKPGIHNAVKRNTLRMLQFIEIPGRYHGRIAALCFEYLQSKHEPVAVKVFSMSVLSAIVNKNRDLQKELRIILEDQMPFASAAYLSRARKVLRNLPLDPM
ncbi:MAG TPA: hypothetical protein VGK59_10395 [Ohtaekwangia sp.]